MSERQWVNKKCELKFHREEAERARSKRRGSMRECRKCSEGALGRSGQKKGKTELVEGSVKPLSKRVTLVESRQFDLKKSVNLIAYGSDLSGGRRIVR